MLDGGRLRSGRRLTRSRLRGEVMDLRDTGAKILGCTMGLMLAANEKHERN
jgi:hypothetical protein